MRVSYRIAVIVTLLWVLVSTGFCREPVGPPPEKFFPFGILIATKECQFFGEPWQQEVGRHAKDWKRHYLNTICAYGMGEPPGSAAEMLDILKPFDIKLWPQLYMPAAYKDKKILNNCAAFLKAHRDSKRILAYTIKDEPKKNAYLPYVESLRFIRQYDPSHPVVSIFFRVTSLYPFLPHLEAISLDCYPIRRGSHDPWYVATEMRDLRRIAGRRPVWFMPQAHSYFTGNRRKKPMRKTRREEIPSPAEHRLMSNLALAAGADGLVWFLYRWNPTWQKLKGRGLVNLIERGGPLWKEIQKQGRTILPVGPLIAGTSVFDCHGVSVKVKQTIPMPKCIHRFPELIRKPRPAITAAVRGHLDRKERFLFLANNDVAGYQSGEVIIDRKYYPDARVFDLYDLKEIPLKNGVRFTVKYESGGGRIYLIGQQVEFDRAKAIILRNRHNNETGRLKVDLKELTKAGVIKDNEKFSAILHQAGQLATKGQAIKAKALLDEVRGALKFAASANAEFRLRRRLLKQAAELWSKMDEDLYERAETIEYEKKKMFEKECRQMMSLARQYMSLKSAFYRERGHNPKLKPSTKRLGNLVKEMERLKKRLDKKLLLVAKDYTTTTGK